VGDDLLSVEVDAQADIATVTVRGELDVHTASTLRQAVTPLLGQVSCIALNVSGLGFMDSSGLGLLVTIHKNVVAAGGSGLRVVDASRPIAGLLEVTGLDRVFEVRPNV
jgi:anti-anti-sigma factor